MICPECNGKKAIDILPKYGGDGKIITSIPCNRCEESGEVPDIQEIWIHLGKSLREERRSRGKTLREEAKMLGIDIVTLSKAERGMINPIRLPFHEDVPKEFLDNLDDETGE